MQKNESLSTTKYIIKARIEIEGIVEKPDIVGAIFGQTEGLLGEDLDLRELQKTGRIGRIQVDVLSEGGKTIGYVIVPSSLNKVETSILASALETVDRVGPCLAKIFLEKVTDIRQTKRAQIIQRAAEILKSWEEKVVPESQEISDEVLKSVRVEEIVKYGEENLPAGPAIDESDTIIIAEGRADVLNLLKYGYKNAIAVEGTNIPRTIIDLCEKKTTIAFVDGDRGGELILKELNQVADVDFVARAPFGKEVEELTRKEIIKALRNKMPFEQYYHMTIEKPKEKVKQEKTRSSKRQSRSASSPSPAHKPEKQQKTPQVPPELIQASMAIQEELIAVLLNEKFEEITKVDIGELADYLINYSNEEEGTPKEKIRALVFDGVVSQRIVDIASNLEIEFIIGARKSELTRKPMKVTILEFSQLNF
ncbi:MAG: DNA primase DnaG [Candidatus Helarchaeota archaeon]